MTAQAGLTRLIFKQTSNLTLQKICLTNEGFSISGIAVLRNPSNDVTLTDPGRLHKLDKLDFLMS